MSTLAVVFGVGQGKRPERRSVQLRRRNSMDESSSRICRPPAIRNCLTVPHRRPAPSCGVGRRVALLILVCDSTRYQEIWTVSPFSAKTRQIPGNWLMMPRTDRSRDSAPACMICLVCRDVRSTGLHIMSATFLIRTPLHEGMGNMLFHGEDE